MGAEEEEEEEEDEDEGARRRLEREGADRRLHEALRLQYGVASTVGYLLQSCPVERVVVPPREEHCRAVVAKAAATVRDSPPPPRMIGREEEQARGCAGGSGSGESSPVLVLPGSDGVRGTPGVWVWKCRRGALRPPDDRHD